MTIKTRMTAAEYERLPETNQLVELIDGELIVNMPPVTAHQRAITRLVLLLDDLAPGGEIFIAPTGVYLDEQNIPEPDILWIAESGKAVVREKYVEGAPDLVIEVFSPSTAKRDKADKFVLYEKHGVREYWMVDPLNEYVEVHRLEAGSFLQQGVYGRGEKFESAVLGSKIVDLSAIFK